MLIVCYQSLTFNPIISKLVALCLYMVTSTEKLLPVMNACNSKYHSGRGVRITVAGLPLARVSSRDCYKSSSFHYFCILSTPKKRGSTFFLYYILFTPFFSDNKTTCHGSLLFSSCSDARNVRQTINWA